jgi:hypothetical protein
MVGGCVAFSYALRLRRGGAAAAGVIHMYYLTWLRVKSTKRRSSFNAVGVVGLVWWA